MEIAQVRDPAGWDPESSRQASGGRSPRRQLRPAGRAGRGEGRGGDRLPALRGTQTVRGGAAQLPGGSRLAGGAGQGAGLDSSSSRTLLGSVLDPPRPWDLRVVPRAIRSGKCPASYLGDARNASSPPHRRLLIFAPLQPFSVCVRSRRVLLFGWFRIY